MILPFPRKKFSAFTLIELLVTIAIIVTLGALLLPTLKKGIEKSRASACVSHLQQIGAGFGMYAAENDGAIPYNTLASGNLTWVQILAPYVDPAIKTYDSSWNPAPSDLGVRPSKVWACPESKALTRQGSYSDYAKNSFISETPTANSADLRRRSGRSAALRDPSKLFAIGDSAATLEGLQCTRALGPWLMNRSGLLARHSQRANVLFFDYHVEAIDLATLPADSYTTQTNPPWSNGTD